MRTKARGRQARRTIRGRSVVALIAAVLACEPLLAQPAPGSPPGAPRAESTRFRFEPVSPQSLGLWQGRQPVFVYHHGAITNASLPNARPHSCYVHPVYGLDGEVLTDDFPKDHVYHRGVYWAWPHIKIGDREYDAWSLRGIRYEFRRWLVQEATATSAILGVENAWVVGDKPVMAERVRIEAQPATENHRVIDFELSWTPISEPITLWGAPEKSYGGFTVRFGPRSKTLITVPSGRASDDLVVTKLPWADFSGDLGRRDGPLSGMAVFVHPSHPDYPPTWMTRHYGLLAVGWPGVTAQTLQPGKAVTCRYRLWIHRGTPEAKKIEEAYAAYRTLSFGP